MCFLAPKNKKKTIFGRPLLSNIYKRVVTVIESNQSIAATINPLLLFSAIYHCRENADSVAE